MSVADLLSVWGATLQVVLLITIAVKPILPEVLFKAPPGVLVADVLLLLSLTSPWAWLPIGPFLFGLVLCASLRIRYDPYSAPDYARVLPIDVPTVFIPLVHTIRLPVWIAIVIGGFVAHFGKHIWMSICSFADRWLGRLVLMMAGLVLPTVSISAGHFMILIAMDLVKDHVMNIRGDLKGDIGDFLAIHVSILFGLCLYFVGVIPLALEVKPIDIRNVFGLMGNTATHVGLPAAFALGKSFAPYGFMVIAVPVGALIPGGARPGLFSAIYGTMLVLLILRHAIRKSGGN